jgi:hypothetical protein
MAAATPTLAAVALILLLPLAAGASDYDSFIRQVTDGKASWPGLLPEAQFAAFVRRHGQRYSGPEEYPRRLRVFAANLACVVAHQALDPSTRHGVTVRGVLHGRPPRRRWRRRRPAARARERARRGAGDGGGGGTSAR